jgi:hypothetical protein
MEKLACLPINLVCGAFDLMGRCLAYECKNESKHTKKGKKVHSIQSNTTRESNSSAVRQPMAHGSNPSAVRQLVNRGSNTWGLPNNVPHVTATMNRGIPQQTSTRIVTRNPVQLSPLNPPTKTPEPLKPPPTPVLPPQPPPLPPRRLKPQPPPEKSPPNPALPPSTKKKRPITLNIKENASQPGRFLVKRIRTTEGGTRRKRSSRGKRSSSSKKRSSSSRKTHRHRRRRS